MVKNFLTFDLENWYDSDFVSQKDKKGKDFVIEGLDRVLSLLEKYDVKATFFVTGDVVNKYSERIKDLHLRGHEIASHSYDHIMLNKLNKDEIKENIFKSKKAIKKAIGEYPKGFRAPSWSISEESFWIYEFLEKEGFQYSSSLFPINVGSYGSFKFPINPFRPSNGKVTEIPVKPITILGIRIPFSGGVYFRLWPLIFSKIFMKSLNNKNERFLIYMHPWEFCHNLPRLKMPVIGKIISYYGIKKTQKKLEFLLKNFKFDSIEMILKEDQKN